MKDDSLKTLKAIQTLALRDLDATSDADLHAEAVAEGEDPDRVAGEMAAHLDGVVAHFVREHAAKAKFMLNATPPAPKRRPILERMKELIDQAFLVDPRLATAFREGTHQSEMDIQSLYDDLVALGKIDPHTDGS